MTGLTDIRDRTLVMLRALGVEPDVRQMRARPGVRLFAFRCPDCGLDTVVDYTSEPEQVWTLDESDYGDGGSTS